MGLAQGRSVVMYSGLDRTTVRKRHPRQGGPRPRNKEKGQVGCERVGPGRGLGFSKPTTFAKKSLCS
jgi:hypothetical protein